MGLLVSHTSRATIASGQGGKSTFTVAHQYVYIEYFLAKDEIYK